MVFSTSSPILPGRKITNFTPQSKKNKTVILNIWKRLVLPRTDYTYSKSLSYSNESLVDIAEDNYKVPIMSRQQLRSQSGRPRKNLGYKEEYQTKSTSHFTHQKPHQMQSANIPSLYGPDNSDDEDTTNYGNYYQSYFGSASNILAYSFNYFLNIIYQLFYFLLDLLDFLCGKLKTLFGVTLYPLRYLLSTGINTFNSTASGTRRYLSYNSYNGQAPRSTAYNQAYSSGYASHSGRSSPTHSKRSHGGHISSSSSASDVEDNNEYITSRKADRPLTSAVKRRGVTRVRQISTNRSPVRHTSPSKHGSPIRPQKVPVFYAARAHSPSHNISPRRALTTSVSRSAVRSRTRRGAASRSPSKGTGIVRSSSPHHYTHGYSSQLQQQPGQTAASHLVKRAYHTLGTGSNYMPSWRRPSGAEYLSSVRTNLSNIGSNFREDLLHRFRSAYRNYDRFKNYLGNYGPYNYSSQGDDGRGQLQHQQGSRGKRYIGRGAGDYGRGHIDTFRDLYRSRRHRNEGLSLCSFPCPFLLFFFLIPLLLSLLLKRVGYDNEYLMKSGIKDYYNPIKHKIDDISDKMYQTLPNMPHLPTSISEIPGGIKNLTRLPSLVYNDTRDFIYHQGKWIGNALPNPMSYYNHYVGGGVDSLIQELDSVKKKLERLEKTYFSPPADEDWWKRRENEEDSTSDRDVRVIIKDTIDKGLKQLRSEFDKSSPGGGRTDKYYESLSNVLDDLKTKFKGFTERTQAQEENVAGKIDKLREALANIGTGKSADAETGGIKSLVGRVDGLNRQLDDLTRQLTRAQTDTRELTDFAQRCCSAKPGPGTTGLNEAIGGDINLMLSKLNLSDLDQSTKEKFIALLREHFASHNKLDELKENLQHNLEKINKELVTFKNNLMNEVKSVSITKTNSISGSDKKMNVEDRRVRQIVEEMLDIYSADQLGMPDYALESAGGSVVSTRCSETFDSRSALIKLFGVPVWYKSNSPRVAIQPGTQPGQCWAFKGSLGYFVVKLATRIKPEAFSIEHIPRSLAPSRNIDSAPKNFTVTGLNSEYDTTGVLLGSYRYEESGRPLQYFLSQNPDAGAFEYIQLMITSNWGNPNFTCLYRFRVHGEPVA